MKTYTLGSQVNFAVDFIDPLTNQPVNPTSVVLRLLDPAGTEHDPVVTGTGTGHFQSVFTPASAGIWSYRWEGSGGVNSAEEGQFEVQPSQFS